ncbi:MAG TPA: DUF485 domain-containing protein [Bacteroidales bacterium]|nr:DUF485 domain-containing protein [Bacteroidales bacterium]
MLHEPAHQETGIDYASGKKSKLGVILFLAYAIIYFGFVLIGVFYPELMGTYIIGGQNMAVVYGFGLIILAIVMGFVYHFICSGYERKMNGGEKK